MAVKVLRFCIKHGSVVILIVDSIFESIMEKLALERALQVHISKEKIQFFDVKGKGVPPLPFLLK